MNGMTRLMEIGAGDYATLKQLFAFKANVGTAPASVVDAAVGRNLEQKALLKKMLDVGSITRKGGDYIWDWTKVGGVEESGMGRLGRMLEAFKYTGDAEKDFGDEHPLIPDMIIDTAVDRRRDVKPEDRAKVVKVLKDKFVAVYKANRDWAEKILNGRSNSGRDMLYAFADHWVDAYLKKGA